MPNFIHFERVTAKSSPSFRLIYEYVFKYLGLQRGFPKTLDCPHLFLYVLVLHKISTKGRLQCLFQDCFSIDICNYDKKNCSPLLQKFIEDVKGHLRKKENKQMIPKMKQIVRSVLNIFIPVLVIAMIFICVKQQMLTPQTCAKLNKFFKDILGGFKIEEQIGTDATKLDIWQLCNKVIGLKQNRSQLQKLKQQFFQKNSQIYYNGQFVQKRKNRKKQQCGPFVLKQPLEFQNIEQIIVYVDGFKDLITNLGTNAKGIQGDKKVTHHKCQSRKKNDKFNIMSQDQQNQQEDCKISQMVDQNQNGNEARMNSNLTQFNSYISIDQFLAEEFFNEDINLRDGKFGAKGTKGQNLITSQNNVQMVKKNNLQFNLNPQDLYILPLFPSPKSLLSSDEVQDNQKIQEQKQLLKFDNKHFTQNFRYTPIFQDLISEVWF